MFVVRHQSSTLIRAIAVLLGGVGLGFPVESVSGDCPEDCANMLALDTYQSPWPIPYQDPPVVYVVDTLDDTCDEYGVPLEGTLRYGIEVETGQRTILFDDELNGVIHLTKNLSMVNESYVTIDGSVGRETSGSGITIADAEFEIINSSFIIIRYLRFRAGEGSVYCSPSLTILGIPVDDTCISHDILIDHCSINDARDDTFGIGGRTCRVEVRNCLIGGGELLGGSKGGLTGWGGYCAYPPLFSEGCDLYLSMHHNIITDTWYRNMRFTGGSRNDFYNNVVANYHTATDLTGYTGAWAEGWCPRVNIINNYYRAPKYEIDNCYDSSASVRVWTPCTRPILGWIIDVEETCDVSPHCVINFDETYDELNADSVYLAGNVYSYWTYCDDFDPTNPDTCDGDIEDGNRATTQPADQWELTSDGNEYVGNGYAMWPTRFKAESPVLADSNAMTPELPPPSADTLSWNSGSDPTSNALCDSLIGYSGSTYGAGPGCRLPLNAPVPDARDAQLLDQLRAGTPSFETDPGIGYNPGIATNPTPADEASCVASGSLLLEWDAADQAAFYRVYLWADGGSPVLVSPSSSLTDTEFTVSVVAGVLYHWKIEPWNGCGKASDEEIEEWTFDTGPGFATSPSPPHFGILCNSGTPVSYSELTLSWTPGTNSNAFDLYLWKNGTTEPALESPTVSGLTSPSHTVYDLVPNSCYNWKIRCRSDCGTGDRPALPWRFKTSS